MSPHPRSDRKSSKHQKRNRNRSTRRSTEIASKNRSSRSSRSSDHDALHLDSPLTDPDIGSLRQPPSLDYLAIAATDSLGGVHSNLAWFKPFNKPAPPPSAPHDDLAASSPEVRDADVDAAAIATTEPIRATRLGKGRARKGDRQGDLVWPEHIEAALIEGLRLYHCTSSEDLHPSHTRNFGRNVKVSRFIMQKTGIHRTTRQISSRIQVLRSLWRDTEDFVLVAQPQELRRMGYKVGVRRPTPRAGPPRGPTTAIRRQTRRASGGGDSRSEPIFVPEGSSTCSALTTYEPTSQREPAPVFDPPSSQTDWTQDIELLLDGGSGSVSAIRSPTLSSLDPVLAPSCDHPMVDMDDDYDLDELLLRLTGHEASSAIPLASARNAPAADLSPQLPPVHYVPMRPSPTVVSDLPLQEAAAALPPLTLSTTFPSPASLDTLTGHYFGGPECPVLSPTVPSAPSLLGSGYATAEGSPDLGMESYLHPDIAFDPTTPFDWTVLAEVALPPQAEPALITERDGGGTPGQYERLESFEFVSPPSITASNGAGNGHVEAHAWWTDFPPHPPAHCTLGQEQEQLRIIELGDVPSPQMQTEPLDEEIQVQITERDAEHPLGPIQPESAYPPTPFVWTRDLDSSQPLSPPVVVEGPGTVIPNELSSPLPSCQHQHHQSTAKKCSCPFCASMPIKRRQRKRKAVAVHEDAAYGADGSGDMGVKQAGKRRKGEPAKPRAKRTKEASGKRRGAKVEETAKVDRVEEPRKEKMFVTTDEQGRLKMLPVRARATQRDEELGESANVQLSETQRPPPLPRAEVPSPPPRPPPAKPMVPRRILPQTEGNLYTAQPLVGHPQSTPNALVPAIARESGVEVFREVPGGGLLAQQHVPPHMVSSLPACSPAPLAAASTTAIGRIVAPLPRYATSYNHCETWNVGLMDIESESEAQLLSALPPPIPRHQAQSHSLNTHNRVDVGQGGGTRVRCQQQVLPVYSECASQYHQPNVAPAPLALASYTHVETLQSQYYHLGVQQQVQRPAQRMQQGAVMYGVSPAEAAQYHHQQQQPAVPFPYAYDPYQGHPYPPLYPHPHPHLDASIYAQMPIDPQYAPQYAQESCMPMYYQPYV